MICSGLIPIKMFRVGEKMKEAFHTSLGQKSFQCSLKSTIWILSVELTKYHVFLRPSLINSRLLKMDMNFLQKGNLSHYSQPQIIVENMITQVQ